MTLLTRLLVVGALLSASANALNVEGGNAPVRARHRRHHPHQERDISNEAADGLVEKSINETTELEERTSPKKIGLGWSGNAESNIHLFATEKTHYMYTWSPYCPASAPQYGLECCPMLWGTKQIAAFQQNKYKGGKCIMGMNEVNVPSQGYLSVPDGVRLWNEYIRPMGAQGYYLVSPSVTSGNDGVAWLQKFLQTCGGGYGANCGVNGIAMHYYGMDVNDFINWTKKFHALTNGDVWITEIACQNFGNPQDGQCDPTHVRSFMDGAIAYINATPWIKCHMFFGLFWDMYNVNPDNRMVDSNGHPNALGLHYINHS